MTSRWSVNETSISMLVASLRCLVVLCSSARKIGPISNTFSHPAAIIICLYSCGLWFRNASLSKYAIGKSSVPPSVAAATIFGVVIAVNPSWWKYWLMACITAERISKTAATRGRRTSRKRASSRVSSSTGTFSDTSSGSGVSARLMISIVSGTSSRPPGAFSMALTVPATRTTDSRETAFTAARTASETFFFGTVTWMMPVRSRTSTKARPPRSRTSWTQPQTSAEPVAGVTLLIGMRISILYLWAGEGNGVYGRAVCRNGSRS